MAFGAVIADEALIKKRKRSNSKPTLMLSRLPQMLIDGDVHSMLAIAAKHKMLGVSSLLVLTIALTRTTTGTDTPQGLGGHCSMGA